MTRIAFITTAAAAIISFGLANTGCKEKESAQNTTDNRTTGEKVKDSAQAAGDKLKDTAQTAGDKLKNAVQPSPDTAMKDTRDTLATAVEAAVTNNGLSDVTERFSKADRDRIGKIDKNSLGDLNAAIDKFRADWKAKYNQDFKLTDKEQVVFGTPIEIKIGDVTDNARLASERTGPTATGTNANTNANDKSVNNVTTVNVPAAGGAPAVTLKLTNEGTVTNSYKIDVPDSLDANKLRDNLTRHLNDVNGMKDQWPADANEAYRVVSQHVLAAIADAK
jgi:hypothetical protein